MADDENEGGEDRWGNSRGTWQIAIDVLTLLVAIAPYVERLIR